MKSLRKVNVSGNHLGPTEAPAAWTVLWETKVRPRGRWSRVRSRNQEEALEQVAHFLKLGFIVHAIKSPDGVAVLDADAIARFAHATGEEPPTGAPRPRDVK